MVWLQKAKAFFKLVKFEHSVFALPFAYLGLFLAGKGFPSLWLFVWVTVAMVAIRTAAMCFNRLIDEPIDAKNPRTRDRVVLINFLTRVVLWLMTAFAVILFVFSAAQLNSLCFMLSPIPVVLVWLYPHLKKITWCSHFVLGIILGIAPYAGWLAARPEWSWIPALLTVAVASWVSGFDMFYALQDMGFDRAYRLKSFPVRFGADQTIFSASLLHGFTVLMLGIVGWVLGLGYWYWMGWLVIVALIVREHLLVRKFGLEKINEAFFNMNALVSIVIFIAAMIDLLARHTSSL